MTAVTPGREELLALATDLSNERPGSRTRAVEMLRRLAAKQADEGVREALEKVASWADIKDSEPAENLSGEEVEYQNGYSAGLRAAGKFARQALSTTGEPKP